MKTQYNWYMPLDDVERSKILAEGMLTVDANVLLDLYRLSPETRSDVLAALDYFKDRLWLSNQAAEEFFKNRIKVIHDAQKSFGSVSSELVKQCEKFKGTLNQLKNNRHIPSNIIDDLSSGISKLCDKAASSIESVGEKYPKYLSEDDVLTHLYSLFDGRVGDAYGADELDRHRKDAEIRFEQKIPPGYEDKSKSGVDQFNDYILWRQALDEAKRKNVPIILITSEQKEDWFSKADGHTFGPRMELLKEAWAETSNKALIFQTHYFLQLISDGKILTFNKGSVDEVEDINAHREKQFYKSVSEYWELANHYDLEKYSIFKPSPPIIHNCKYSDNISISIGGIDTKYIAINVLKDTNVIYVHNPFNDLESIGCGLVIDASPIGIRDIHYSYDPIRRFWTVLQNEHSTFKEGLYTFKLVPSSNS